MYHSSVGAIVAAGDTVKTTLGELEVPAGASKLIGVACHALGGPGNTTLENVTGMFELESRTVANLIPCQFLLDCVPVLTSAPASVKPTIWPVDVPVAPGNKIECFVTMDMAQTIANTCRWMAIWE